MCLLHPTHPFSLDSCLRWRRRVRACARRQVSAVKPKQRERDERRRLLKSHIVDHGVQAYDDGSQYDAWVQMHDHTSAHDYWYNCETGESRWTDPNLTGWIERTDPATGRTYYYHTETEQSSWSPPAGYSNEDGRGYAVAGKGAAGKDATLRAISKLEGLVVGAKHEKMNGAFSDPKQGAPWKDRATVPGSPLFDRMEKSGQTRLQGRGSGHKGEHRQIKGAYYDAHGTLRVEGDGYKPFAGPTTANPGIKRPDRVTPHQTGRVQKFAGDTCR